ncbi:Adenylate cyclase [Diplonema papillatum]|nr:Adenylate cyclase [Diplonema papillatum]
MRPRRLVSLRVATLLASLLVVLGTLQMISVPALFRASEFLEAAAVDQLVGISYLLERPILRYFQAASRKVEFLSRLANESAAARPEDPIEHISRRLAFYTGVLGEKGIMSIVAVAARYAVIEPNGTCNTEMFAMTPFIPTYRHSRTTRPLFLMLAPGSLEISTLDANCMNWNATFLWTFHKLPGIAPETGLTEPQWATRRGSSVVYELAVQTVLFPISGYRYGGYGAVSVAFTDAQGSPVFEEHLTRAVARSSFETVAVLVIAGDGELYGISSHDHVLLAPRPQRFRANDPAALGGPPLAVSREVFSLFCEGAFGAEQCTWPRQRRRLDFGGFVVVVLPLRDPFARGFDVALVAYVSRSEVEERTRDLQLKQIIVVCVCAAGWAVAMLLVGYLARGLSKYQTLLNDVSELRGLEAAAAHQIGGEWITEVFSLNERLRMVSESLAGYAGYLPAGLAGDDADADGPEPPGRKAGENPLRGGVAAPPARKLAVLFTDVPSCARLWDAAPHLVRRAVLLYNGCVRASLTRFSGYEVKVIGEGFMVAFADVHPAVSFALDVQENLMHVEWPAGLLHVRECSSVEGAWCGLRVKMGLHKGPAERQLNPLTRRHDYFGATVNTASRICNAALEGCLALPADVMKAISFRWAKAAPLRIPLGHVHLKGIADSIDLLLLVPHGLPGRQAFLAVSLRTGSEAHSHSQSGSLSTSRLASALGRKPSVRTLVSTFGFVRTPITDHTVEPVEVLRKILTSVLCAANRTNGSIQFLSGSGVAVVWNTHRKQCKDHVTAGVLFAGNLEKVCANVSVGLATGPLFSADSSVSRFKFILAIGFVVELSVELAHAASYLNVFALSSSVPGYPNPSTYGSLVYLTRPIDTWGVGGGGQIVVYEVRLSTLPVGGGCRWAVDESWEWSKAYAEAFHARQHEGPLSARRTTSRCARSPSSSPPNRTSPTPCPS